MGYFGSAYGSNWSANAPSSNSMMFTPNQYGGYSTIAGGSSAGQEATRQLQQLRGILSGPNGGSGATAYKVLQPYMNMAVMPSDLQNRMQQTFQGAGMNFNNIMGKAIQYAQGPGGPGSLGSLGAGLGIPTSSGSGGAPGQGQSGNPLSYLSGVFGQYGSGAPRQGGGGGGGGSYAPAGVAANGGVTNYAAAGQALPSLDEQGFVSWNGQTFDTADPNWAREKQRQIDVTSRYKGPDNQWTKSTRRMSIGDYLDAMANSSYNWGQIQSPPPGP
jgi:hypothetical protein